MQNNQVRTDGFARTADRQKLQNNMKSSNRKKQGQQSSYDEIRGKIKTECEE